MLVSDNCIWNESGQMLQALNKRDWTIREKR